MGVLDWGCGCGLEVVWLERVRMVVSRLLAGVPNVGIGFIGSCSTNMVWLIVLTSGFLSARSDFAVRLHYLLVTCAGCDSEPVTMIGR